MEASIICATRGHNVTLVEKTGELGGQIRLACVPIGKQELTKIVKNMHYRLNKLGVDIRLNTPITKEMLEGEFKGYEVICAAGAKANTIKPFECFKSTMTADEILEGSKFPGQKIVIIGGGSVGCELADYLAPLLNDRFPRNRRITLLEMLPEVMLSETGPGRSVLVMRMMDKGVDIQTNAKVSEVTENTIKYEQNGILHEINDADTLVFANGYHTDNTLEDLLKEAGSTYHLIGDGAKVGNIKDAIGAAWNLCKDL